VAHWRQDHRPVLTLEDAETWFERHPLTPFLPRHTQLPAPAPSFVEACLGEPHTMPPRTAIEQATELLVRLMGSGKVVGLNLLGSVGEQPDFVVSTELLPFLIVLRGDRDWKQVPQTSGGHKVSPLVAEVWKTLERRGSLSASAIREDLGRELTDAAALRALSELWQDFRAIPVLQAGGQAALWELLQLHHRQELTSGSSMSQVTALSLLVSMYLQSVYAASSEEIEVFLSPLASRSRIREAVRGLSATRQIHSLSMDAQTYYFVEGGLPEFAPLPSRPDTSAVQRRSPDRRIPGRSPDRGPDRNPDRSSDRRQAENASPGRPERRPQRADRPARKPYPTPGRQPLFPAASEAAGGGERRPRDARKGGFQSRPRQDAASASGARPFRNRPQRTADSRPGSAQRPSGGKWKASPLGRGFKPKSGPQERWKKFSPKPESEERPPSRKPPASPGQEWQSRGQSAPGRSDRGDRESRTRPTGGGADRSKSFRSSPGFGRSKSFGQGPGRGPGQGPGARRGGPYAAKGAPQGAPRGDRPARAPEGGFRPPSRGFPPKGDQREARPPKWRQERPPAGARPAGTREDARGKAEGRFKPRWTGSRPARAEGAAPKGDRTRFPQERRTPDERTKFPPRPPFRKRTTGADDRRPARSGSETERGSGANKGSSSRFSKSGPGRASQGKPRGFAPRSGSAKPSFGGNRKGGKPSFRGRTFGKKRPEA
jgi:23S rRNA pseudouridine2605 synthase